MLQWIYISPLNSAFCEEPSKDVRRGKCKSTWNLSLLAPAVGLLRNITAKKLLLRKDREIVSYTLKIQSEERDEESF